MTYTILSAAYANPEHTAALLMTQEAAAVLISEADTPDEWAAMLSGGVSVAPYAPPPPTIDEYRAAIQAHVDTAAQARNYDSGLTCASYAGSTNPAWAAEAEAFVAWRDAVWVYAFAELAKVQGGQRPQPMIPEFLAELPALIWPA